MKGMEMIYFEAVKNPGKLVCNTDAVRWHVLHGWCYNVWSCDSNAKKAMGVFYVTLLCGAGGILHFDAAGKVSGAELLEAFHKGLRIVKPYLALMLATIPKDKEKLARAAKMLGFEVLPGGDFAVDGVDYSLLKYLKR